jgi:hypothetical protein
MVYGWEVSGVAVPAGSRDHVNGSRGSLWSGCLRNAIAHRAGNSTGASLTACQERTQSGLPRTELPSAEVPATRNGLAEDYRDLSHRAATP